MARPITFLSDYGLADEFVGVVHGVIARVCPEALAGAGTPLEPVAPAATRPRSEGRALVAHVVGTDTFGNAVLDAVQADLLERGLPLGEPIAVRTGARRVRGVVARTFSDVQAGGLLLYEDAGGSLALAVNGGDAAALLGLRVGDEVRLEGE